MGVKITTQDLVRKAQDLVQNPDKYPNLFLPTLKQEEIEEIESDPNDYSNLRRSWIN
jgi:hypothetical protein